MKYSFSLNCTTFLFLFLFLSCYSQSCSVGESLLSNYVEWICGDMPFIISVPHDGQEEPSTIPDRPTSLTCRTGDDSNTKESAQLVSESIFNQTEHSPHVIIFHLARKKVDANREPTSDTDEQCVELNQEAREAWNTWHSFIDQAQNIVINDFGKGLYVDWHSQNQDAVWTQIGMCISSTYLAMSDDDLNQYANYSCIRNLANTPGTLAFSELVRSNTSLCGFLETDSPWSCVPGLTSPSPENTVYWEALIHESMVRGNPVQLTVETHSSFIRTAEDRMKYSQDIGRAFLSFLVTHYDFEWGSGSSLTSSGGENNYTGGAVVAVALITLLIGVRVW